MQANKVVVGRDEMDRLVMMRLDVDRYENETIPNLPQIKSGKSFAVLCSGSTCQPPVSTAEELRQTLTAALRIQD